MGMLSLDRRHPDYLKVRVLVTLFGGYFGSRLMSNIREDKGYTYGISAGIMPYPDSGLLVVNAETANEFVEPLIKEVYHEIDRLQNDLVPVEELAMVRNYMLGDMCRSYESAFSLADARIFIHTSGLPDSYVRDAVEAVKTITPAEIRELASRYLCKETLKRNRIRQKNVIKRSGIPLPFSRLIVSLCKYYIGRVTSCYVYVLLLKSLIYNFQ